MIQLFNDHNPDGLLQVQVQPENGWRLCLWCEREHPPTDVELWLITENRWVKRQVYEPLSPLMTYRTKAGRPLFSASSPYWLDELGRVAREFEIEWARKDAAAQVHLGYHELPPGEREAYQAIGHGLWTLFKFQCAATHYNPIEVWYNWGQQPEASFAAINALGLAYWFTNEPKLDESTGSWILAEGSKILIPMAYYSFPPNTDWKMTKQAKPSASYIADAMNPQAVARWLKLVAGEPASISALKELMSEFRQHLDKMINIARLREEADKRG